MTESAKFKQAVEYAKSKISAELQKPEFGLDLSTNQLERLGIMGFSKASHQHEYLESLVEASDEDIQMRKSFQLGIAWALENEIELPEIAKDWLLKLLKGELPKLVGRKGRPKNYRLEALIYHTVQDLKEEHGINPTRNDSSPAISGSDAVAEALRQLEQLPNSYDRVRKIWQKKPGLRVVLDK